MKLYNKIFEQTVLSFFHQGQKFIFGTLTNIIVVQTLIREDVGLVGIIAGYYILITWFAISPQNTLLQRYKTIRNESFGKYVSMTYTFSILRDLSLILLSLLIGLFLWNIKGDVQYFYIFVLYTIAQVILNFSGEIQFFLKFEFKQKSITLFTGVISILKIAMLSMLFVNNDIYLYLGILIASSVLEVIIFTYLLKKEVAFTIFHSIRETLKTSKEQIISFALWHHIGNNLIKYMYEIDTVFLGIWSSLIVVGNYSIALKIANLSFIVPSLIQSSAGLALTRIEDPKEINKAVNLFLKYSFIISVSQMFFFFLIGKFYISLHTDQYVNEIYKYLLLISIGAAIVNTIRPIISFISAKTNMKSFFFSSILPSALLTSFVYPVSSYLGGGEGIAIGNIVCYTFWSATMLLYAYKNKFKLEFELIDPREKKLLNQYILRKTND